MEPVSKDLIKVADNQIKYLAKRSTELDQETRVTVYSFNTTGYVGNAKQNIECLIYDKDVLRMPSISELYSVDGATPLIDATITALDDLAMTPEKYGEHSFLVYVLTDGEENASRNKAINLTAKIGQLPDNWTLATFVPNQVSVHEAKRFGFPAQNIAVWDATTQAGVNEMGEKIRQTTETFMVNRSKGIRGTKNLFSLDTPSLDAVDQTLKSLNWGQFRLLDVEETGRIDEFVESRLGRPYKLGEAYYQLMKPETIQPQKDVAILSKKKLYVGHEARTLLGLPDFNVKVSPGDHPDYEVFVQSTSVNRKLIEGTKLLVMS
jgi:hypothetical protein